MVCILFIHQNFPGQFLNISKFLSTKYDVISMSFSNSYIEGIPHYQCICKSGNKLNEEDLSLEFESKVIRAQIVQNKCIELDRKGIRPDIIINHCGWGESLLIKNIWPNVKLISYMELYYKFNEDDALQLKNKLTLRNSPYLLSLVESDYCISPTEYQKNTFPKIFHDKIDVIFEGVNTQFFKKRNLKEIKIGELKQFEKWKYKILDESSKLDDYTKIYNIDISKNQIITFVSRDLTPLRGYDIFMEALPKILDKFPNTIVIIVGEDGNSYCGSAIENQSYYQIFWNKIKDKVDNKKIFFLGRVHQSILVDIFSISTINIYITLPFCLSWSFMEALSTEVLMVTNNCKPMSDVITNNVNCLTYKDNKLDELVINILKDPSKYNKIRKSARELILKKYDLLNITLPKYDSLIKKLL